MGKKIIRFWVGDDSGKISANENRMKQDRSLKYFNTWGGAISYLFIRVRWRMSVNENGKRGEYIFRGGKLNAPK